jgi:lysophospholipase L1-like esterase
VHAHRSRLFLLLARAALVLTSLALVIGIGEVVARLTWQERVNPPRSGEVRDLPSIKGRKALSAANANGLHKGAYYRTNAHAIRGPEYLEHPEPGTFRIAMTGDSITMGWGVEEGFAYPAQVEARLNANPLEHATDTQGQPVQHFEVLNFGLAGLNTLAAIRRLEQKSRIYSPALAVYGFTINDIEGAHYRRSDDAKVNSALADRYRAHYTSSSYLLRTLWPNWIALRERISPTPGSLRVTQFENYFENPKAWANLDRGLARFRKFGESNGLCSVVFIHTHLTQLGPFHLYHPIYDKVADAAAAHGLPVVRSYPAFDSARASAYWVSYWDAHPNASAHALLANVLEAGLRELPENCWRAD